MAKLTTLLNRIFMSIVFVLSCTRGAVTRILPSYEPASKAPSAKVFALTEAAWLELRARDAGDEAKSESKGAERQQESSKRGEDAKPPSTSNNEKQESSKEKDSPKASEDKKEPSKSADSSSKSEADKKDASPSGEEKKKDASKSGQSEEQGLGGGDGDMGGTGG